MKKEEWLEGGGGGREREIGKTYTLEDLLAADVLQAGVEVADAADEVLHLGLVGALDLARLADGQVQLQPDAAVGAQHAQPVLAPAAARRREADPVLARVRRAEREPPRRAAPLRYHAVVVVEELLFFGFSQCISRYGCMIIIRVIRGGGRERETKRTSTEM